MSKVTIYRFKVYSADADDLILSQRWGTKDAIRRIGGLPIEGTAIETDEAAVANPIPDMIGISEKGFDPRPREHGGDSG